MSQKLPFPSLIFELLEGQKPLKEPNEFLSALVQPYVFRMKEKSVGVEGEKIGGVATDPPVARESQVEHFSFLKGELQTIKDM